MRRVFPQTREKPQAPLKWRLAVFISASHYSLFVPSIQIAAPLLTVLSGPLGVGHFNWLSWVPGPLSQGNADLSSHILSTPAAAASVPVPRSGATRTA